LANEEWKNDKIPEMWFGKNIADFVDPDIMAVSIPPGYYGGKYSAQILWR